jgi:translation initiation factor 2 subunit 1
VPNELAKILAEIAEERVSTPLVEVKGIVELSCMKPDGVEVIKEAFQKAGEHKESEDAELRFYVVATPKYRIKVMAENYKLAENVLQSVADEVISHIVNAGGQGSFKREK